MSTLKSFNPANLELVGELAIHSSEDIRRIVESAKSAQISWAETNILKRRELILHAYEGITEKQEAFADLIHREMGKPENDAAGELRAGLGDIERLTEEIVEALQPEETLENGTKSTIYHDPFGVNVAITPWNFPFLMIHDLIVPSLIAGNVVILKPSEEAFLVGKLFVDIMNEFLPQCVLQIVIGTGEQGKILVNQDIQLITFVGSKKTGSDILQNASKDLKRVILELGGKDPMIVLDDADLTAAAKFAAHNSFRNSGQVCVSTERIYVMNSVANKFIDELKEATKKIKIGPMVHNRQKQHVENQVQEAVNQGAEIIYGSPSNSEGNYLEPMIMTKVNHNMSIMKDETFGPVACIMQVNDEEEAVRLANETQYGLGAVVFGANTEKTKKVARRLTAGMVGINKSCGGVSGTPWVGAGHSGYGFHSSKEGHKQFTQVRVITAAS